MRKIILAFALLITPAAVALAAEFEVSIAADTPRVATIEARLTPHEGRISLSRNGTDTGLYHGWATFVHEIEAFADDNDPMALEYVTGGHWQLAEYAGGPVTVKYTMLLQHDRFPNDPGEDELAWARDWGVMWTGRALFVEGADDGAVGVNFDLPEGWKVSTPWAGSGVHFTADDYDALLDSAFVAGTHREIRIGDADSPEAIIALGGEAPLAAADLITGLVSSAHEGFTALFAAPPAGRLLLIGADASFWGGGVMGSTISMVFGGALDESTTPMLAYITTHEMFHLWNANFNVADRNSVEALYWFSEGAAEYYTWRNFVDGGLADEDAFRAELGNRHQAYMAARDAENGELSMSAAGATKLDHYDLIYSGGMMAVAALDAHIRTASEGEKSLDDALRLLQARYPKGSDASFRASELPDLIAEATGVDVTEIFDRYINGTEVLTLADFVDQ